MIDIQVVTPKEVQEIAPEEVPVPETIKRAKRGIRFEVDLLSKDLTNDLSLTSKPIP